MPYIEPEPDPNSTPPQRDLAYWLQQSYAARWAEMERLRSERHGWDPQNPPPIERVVRIVRLKDKNLEDGLP